MNVNEYGIVFAFSTGFNMTGFTSLSLKFTKPDMTTLTVTNPAVAVGSVDLETTAGVFEANQYVTYSFVNGDVNQVGEWTVRLTYDDATPQHLISDVGTFSVNP